MLSFNVIYLKWREYYSMSPHASIYRRHDNRAPHSSKAQNQKNENYTLKKSTTGQLQESSVLTASVGIMTSYLLMQSLSP